MDRAPGRIFDTIESAHDFVGLLSETVTDIRKEIDADVEKALDSQSPRRLQALRIVSYNLDKLATHMKMSCRILNDLRSLRRLLCEERTAAATSIRAEAGKVEETGSPARVAAPNTLVPSATRQGSTVAA